MTRTREWVRTFSDPAVMSDLFAAAHDAMRQICEHDPSECDCPLNRATFHEWAEWVQLEVERERGKPVRIEPAGRPGRKEAAHIRRLSMAATG